MRLASYVNCLRLNLRMARHVLAGRWLQDGQVAASYDRLAPEYGRHWLVHLRSTTDQLLGRLPESLPSGNVFDLGCGTGYATLALRRRYPARPLLACDIAAGMLQEAEAAAPGQAIAWEQAEMLEFLRRQPATSAALVFSAWSLGYSHPPAVLREVARVLVPGGILAVVVNLADTLAPLSRAFRMAMQAHPGQVSCAIRYRFPRDLESLRREAVAVGLEWKQGEEGRVAIPLPAAGNRLPWLLKTGTLAGFDAVLPLQEDAEVARSFEEALAADPRPVEHHYALFLARKPGTAVAPSEPMP